MCDILQKKKSLHHSATIKAYNMICGKGQIRTQDLGYISGALWPLRYTPSCYTYCTCLSLSAPWTSKSLWSAGRGGRSRLSNCKAWKSYRKAWNVYITCGVGGVCAPGGSSRARRSQNSSSGPTANTTQHRNSMHYHGMHNMYNAYKRIIAIMCILLEFCWISRIVVKIMSIIVVLKVIKLSKKCKTFSWNNEIEWK